MTINLKLLNLVCQVLLLAGVSGCDSKSQIQVPSTVKSDCVDNTQNQDDDSDRFELIDSPTYEDDIAFILEDNCLSCHGKGGNDPELHNWSSVDDAKRKLVNAVENERMPPSEDLNEGDREVLLNWGETGYARDSSDLKDDDEDDDEAKNTDKKNDEDGNTSTSSSKSDCE